MALRSVGDIVANRYCLLRILGKGSFGIAWLVSDSECKDQNYKLKVLKETHPHFASVEDSNEATHEGRLLNHLNHQCIIRYFEHFFQLPCFYIVTEYAEGGDLAQLISDCNRRGAKLEETQVVEWLIQILLAVSYIHSCKVIHRDIKPANIFLHRNIVKIGDFGISRLLHGCNSVASTAMKGTIFYMSPEMLNNKPYNSKVDIWSIGCVLYELVALKRAYVTMASLTTISCKNSLPKWPRGYKEELRDIYERLCKYDPQERQSADEALASDFLVANCLEFIEKLNITEKCKSSKNPPKSPTSPEPEIDENSAWFRNLSPTERMRIRKQKAVRDSLSSDTASTSSSELESSRRYLPVLTEGSTGEKTLSYPIQVGTDTSTLIQTLSSAMQATERTGQSDLPHTEQPSTAASVTELKRYIKEEIGYTNFARVYTCMKNFYSKCEDSSDSSNSESDVLDILAAKPEIGKMLEHIIFTETKERVVNTA